MEGDIRGFLPRKHLAKLVRWFHGKSDRENFVDCLNRELEEELLEVGLPRITRPDDLNFRLVRSIREGPGAISGQAYSQFRIFDVYDVHPLSNDGKKFIRKLFKAARRHPNLLLASANEIIAGRAMNGNVIGHHAGYLIGRKRVGPETPAFVSLNTRRF